MLSKDDVLDIQHSVHNVNVFFESLISRLNSYFSNYNDDLLERYANLIVDENGYFNDICEEMIDYINENYAE